MLKVPFDKHLVFLAIFAYVLMAHVFASGLTTDWPTAGLMALVLSFTVHRKLSLAGSVSSTSYLVLVVVALLSMAITWVTSSPFLAACGVALLWALGRGLHAESKLHLAFLPAVFMTQPWLESFPSVAYWFRLTGTELTGVMYRALGFSTTYDGTWMQIEQQPIVISEACAGTVGLTWSLFVSLLLCGYRDCFNKRTILVAGAAIIIAWAGNVLRIWGLTGTVLWQGPSSSEWFHTYVNPIIACCIIAMSVWATMGVLRTRLAVLNVLFILLACGMVLPLFPSIIDAALNSPRDRALPIMFTVWVAIGIYIYWGQRRSLPVEQSVTPVIAVSLAIILFVFSLCLGVNAFGHVGLSLLCATLLQRPLVRWLWALTAMAWWPSVSYYAAGYPLAVVEAARILVLFAPLVAMRLPAIRAPVTVGQRRFSQSFAGVSVVCAILWMLHPPAVDANRLDAGQMNGLKWPLNKTEEVFYGNADVRRWLFPVHKKRMIVTVINGSGNRHAVHDPWYCCQSKGWRVTDLGIESIAGGEAQQVKIDVDGQDVWLCWWYSDGETRWTDHSQYLWRTTLRRLTRGYTGPEPYLVICQTIDGTIFPNELQHQIAALRQW